MIDLDDLDRLARMVDEADARDGDPDLEAEPDGEDVEGMIFVNAGGVDELPDWVTRTAEWGWNPHYDGDLDTSAEQWGEPAWLGE